MSERFDKIPDHHEYTPGQASVTRRGFFTLGGRIGVGVIAIGIPALSAAFFKDFTDEAAHGDRFRKIDRQFPQQPDAVIAEANGIDQLARANPKTDPFARLGPKPSTVYEAEAKKILAENNKRVQQLQKESDQYDADHSTDVPLCMGAAVELALGAVITLGAVSQRRDIIFTSDEELDEVQQLLYPRSPRMRNTQ